MKLLFLIVVVMCGLLPEAFGLVYPIKVTTKASILCAPKVTTKVPTTCAPKTTKAPTTCAPKTTKKVPTTCAPKTTKKAPTTAPKTTTKAPLPVCGTNEVYSECGATGCVNTCANPTFSQISRCRCIPGCICIDGYLRNSKNVCVAPQQCDTCKENEEFSACDAHGCRNTCAEPDLLTRCTYAAGCYPGCICKEGFLKNAEGVCVLEATCVNRCPNPNESYNTCGTACPKTCDNKDKEIMCTFQCVQGCFCNDGYVRDANGLCILPDECPRRCPEHEAYDECGTACQKTCETKDAMIKCTANCVAGCFCLEGYVREDNSGKCVLEGECPPPPTCGENEVYDKCPPTSPAEGSCVNVFKGTKPSHPSPCKAACKCQPGYVRNGNSCVVEEKCCSDPNAELVKKLYCCGGGTIANPDWIIGCKVECDPKGCQCKKGYLKKSDTDATCISAIKENICKENEEFSACDAHGCRNTCEEPDLLTRCTYVAGCYPGCICKEGFLKNADGVCVPEATCAKQCPENEAYNECGTACPKTCKTKDAMIKCTFNCVAGCFCLDGYVRDDTSGKCIPERDCPLVCGPNQVVNECPPCPEGQICPAVCIPRCECIPGYIFDTTGTCIVKESPPPKCGKNEVYDKCPPTSPAESSCVDVFMGTKPAHPSPCKAACKCQSGYVRNGKSCVVEAKCCSDPNAELVKNPYCCGGGTIANPDWFIGCKRKCDHKGCQCKKGYLKKSDTDSTCVSAIEKCKTPLPVPAPVPGPVPYIC